MLHQIIKMFYMCILELSTLILIYNIIIFGAKLISICECLNLMTMQVYAFFLLLLLLFSFCLFSLVLLLVFCLHVILINEFKTFENIVKFLKAPSLFLYFVFIKLIRLCIGCLLFKLIFLDLI